MPEAPRFFRLHNDYSQLLSGAHRKPATPVGPPALVAHFAFWQPGIPKDSEDKRLPCDLQNTDPNKKYDERVDNYIRALYCLIRKEIIDTPNTDAKSIDKARFLFLFSSAIDLGTSRYEFKTPKQFDDTAAQRIDRYFDTSYQSVVLHFMWHNLYVTLRFEKHHEYLALTAFIDMSPKPTSQDRKPISEEVLAKEKVYTDLLQQFRKFELDVEKYKTEDENQDNGIDIDHEAWRQTMSKHHVNLYTDIWDKFIGDILLSRSPLREAGVDIDGTVDDRRHLLGPAFADFRGLIVSPPHHDPQLKKGTVFQHPAWRTFGRSQRKWQGDILTSDESAKNAGMLFPFITSEPRLPLEKREFTVSRMLGGRVIYMTALGAQPSPYLGKAVERQPDQIPLYYLVYTNAFSQWQIGRLIDNINHLGTVRIAAIQELIQLREKSRELRNSPEPQEANDSILSTVENIRDRSDEILKLQKKIVNWNKSFEGGLSYRIERSRYYVKQFNDGLAALRIRRVEGYQPYDVFVRRRLGATFDFIDRLGIRLERFERKIVASSQYVMAYNAIHSAKTLVSLQSAAEIFIWLVASPYYVTNLLEHINEKFEFFEKTMVGYLDILVCIFFLFVTIFRMIKLKSEI